MSANRHFVRSSDLSAKTATLIGDTPAVSSYKELIGRVEALAGRDAAALFAEPVLPATSSSVAAVISWYSAFEGTATPLQEIDEIARRPVARKLTERLEALGSALRDSTIGAAVATWLNVPSSRDILSVGGEPVLVNWGFLPEGLPSDLASREAHFAGTLGGFARGLSLPPVAVPALSSTNPQAATPFSSAGSSQASDVSAPSLDTPVSSATSSPVANAVPVSPIPRPHPPWRGPAIATAVALGVLLILLLPGVLVYPNAKLSERDTVEEQQLRASNDSLEAQLKALRERATEQVCRADDTPVTVPGLPAPPGQAKGKNDPEQPARMDPVPKAPDQVALPRGADAARGDAANVGELLDKATVMVFGLSPVDGKRQIATSQGSGFFVSSRHIVTNHHVIEHVDGRYIFVASRALGGIRHARLVAKSEPPPSEAEVRVDLALLEIEDGDNRVALRLGPTPPKLATAYVAGFPGFVTKQDLNFDNFVDQLLTSLRQQGDVDAVLRQQKIDVPSSDLRYGRVNNFMNTGKNALPVIIHDMQLAQGNSGGPLVDGCGRLGGVNTLFFANKDGPQTANVAQDVSLVRKFLSDNRIKFANDESPCGPNLDARGGEGVPPQSPVLQGQPKPTASTRTLTK